MNAALGISAAGLTAAADAFAQRAASLVQTTTVGAAPQPQATTLPDAVGPPAQSQAGAQGDITRDVVGMLSDKAAFKANAAMVRAADEQTGVLLDILA